MTEKKFDTEKSKTGIKTDSEEDLEQLFGTPLSDGPGQDFSSESKSSSGNSEDPEKLPDIENFESLEDFTNDPASQQTSESPSHSSASSSGAAEDFPSFTNPGMDFSPPSATESHANPETNFESGLVTGLGADLGGDSFADPVPDPPFNNDLGLSTGSVTIPTPTEPPTPESKPPTMDSIKEFSESVTTGQSAAGASFPFTLKIDGHLTPQEAEKLLDVMNRENMGFREVDLEPQLAEGKILIPRISEYAGIVLIQALRGVQAKISFGLSDLFEGDTEVSEEGRPDSVFTKIEGTAPLSAESAEALPTTQGDELPQLGVYQVSDTLIVSGILSTRSLENSSSPEYAALLEALMRELKFKAFRRKARGITHLKIQVTPLTLPTDHRITVSGTLVI